MSGAIYAYATLPPPRGYWRNSCRATILRIVREAMQVGDLSHEEVLKRVDDAYPFGERANYVYKAWLAERRLFIASRIGAQPGDFVGSTTWVWHLPRTNQLPSREEVGVVEVAHDLFELGKEDEAKALLLREAPNRLERECPLCHARPGVSCRSVTVTIAGKPVGLAFPPFLVVPHLERVRMPDAGPLFGGQIP